MSKRGSDFYPRPPRGGRPFFVKNTLVLWGYFYPRPPRGGRPGALVRKISSGAISIHALREEGDKDGDGLQNAINKFLSTPSARRATSQRASPARHLRDFYPRPPRGGRHDVICDTIRVSRISIHALREEGDHRERGRKKYMGAFLSTPSARRATRTVIAARTSRTDFYPRPPRGGRPIAAPVAAPAAAISIHALREEGDDA